MMMLIIYMGGALTARQRPDFSEIEYEQAQ
jgi:hypothetical protein